MQITCSRCGFTQEVLGPFTDPTGNQITPEEWLSKSLELGYGSLVCSECASEQESRDMDRPRIDIEGE